MIIIIFLQCNLSTLVLFAFTRFYLRVLADGNGIVLGLKQDVILDRPYGWMNRAKEKSGSVDSIGGKFSSEGVQADAKTPGGLGFVLAGQFIDLDNMGSFNLGKGYHIFCCGRGQAV